jgi:hypothetical protein
MINVCSYLVGDDCHKSGSLRFPGHAMGAALKGTLFLDIGNRYRLNGYLDYYLAASSGSGIYSECHSRYPRVSSYF